MKFINERAPKVKEKGLLARPRPGASTGPGTPRMASLSRGIFGPAPEAIHDDSGYRPLRRT
jgi:hypothetical protein